MKSSALSIKGYIIVFFGLLTVLLAVYFSIIMFYKNAEKDDASVIDVAGRNRMLSQKIGFYSGMLVRGSEDARTHLRSAADLHGNSLEILKNGGLITLADGQIQLPPCPDEIIPIINKVEKAWKQYEINAWVLIKEVNKGADANHSKSVMDALHYIDLNGQKMLDLDNQLVQKFVSSSAKKGSEFIAVLITISALVLVFFLLAFRILNKNILEALKTIGNVADDVAEGAFSNRIPDQVDPYLSKISNAINDLGNNINQAALFAASIGQGKFDFQF